MALRAREEDENRVKQVMTCFIWRFSEERADYAGMKQTTAVQLWKLLNWPFFNNKYAECLLP